MNVLAAFIFSQFILGFCNGQATRTYSCAIASLCRDLVIDPRAGPPETQVNIVAPGSAAQTECPTGTVRCNSVVCGSPSVAVSTSSGFATANSLPWQAYLRDDQGNRYIGGGVLIDQYHVLTAAHKVSNLTGQGATMSVTMGVYNPASVPQSPAQVQAPLQQSKVARAYIHNSFNKTMINNLKEDVAILRLVTPMSLTASTMTMCLPADGTNFVPSPASSCLVAGWGQSGFSTFDAPTTNLKQVYVPIVASATCIQAFQTINSAIVTNYLDTASGKQFCAGGLQQQDACTQDGGSPLICRTANSAAYSLAGLVLWGKGCGEVGRYGVYLNVPTYLTWIRNTLQCSTQGSSACPNADIQTFST